MTLANSGSITGMKEKRGKPKPKKLGLDSNDLMIVIPDRFQDRRDGSCHPSEIRKLFWTDVLKSLERSYDLLFHEARFLSAKINHS